MVNFSEEFLLIAVSYLISDMILFKFTEFLYNRYLKMYPKIQVKQDRLQDLQLLKTCFFD